MKANPSHWFYLLQKRSVRVFYLLSFIVIYVLFFSCAQENPFNENNGRIAIDSIAPAQGTVGTQVRVYGKGFSADPDANIVTVNGVIAKVLDPVGLSALLIEIPNGAKTGNVKLKIGTTEVTGPQFTLINPPVYKDIKPSSGFEGTVVTLFGSGFKQITKVLFNGVAATIQLQEEDRIEVKAPASTTGMITLDYGYGQLQTAVFTYLPIPLIRSASDGGKGIQLAASYINPVASALSVTYNGTAVSILNITDISGNTANLLPAYPNPAINNPFDIILTSNGIKSLPYRYTIKPEIDKITASIVSRTETTVTYDFTIDGKYFSNSAANNSVKIRFLSRVYSDVPNTLQSWTATKIVTRITGSVVFSDTGTYGEYFGSVTVNGVASSEVKVQ